MHSSDLCFVPCNNERVVDLAVDFNNKTTKFLLPKAFLSGSTTRFGVENVTLNIGSSFDPVFEIFRAFVRKKAV